MLDIEGISLAEDLPWLRCPEKLALENLRLSSVGNISSIFNNINCDALKEVTINRCDATNLTIEMTASSQLERIDINGFWIWGHGIRLDIDTVTNATRFCSKLKNFRFEGNVTPDSCVALAEYHPNLTHLHLVSRHYIRSEYLITLLLPMLYLQDLRLDSMHVTSAVLVAVASSLKSLKRVRIKSGYDLDLGITSLLENAKDLERLELNGCEKFTGCVGEVTSSEISVLVIERCGLTDVGICELLNALPHLKQISVVDCEKLTVEGAANIATLCLDVESYECTWSSYTNNINTSRKNMLALFNPIIAKYPKLHHISLNLGHLYQPNDVQGGLTQDDLTRALKACPNLTSVKIWPYECPKSRNLGSLRDEIAKLQPAVKIKRFDSHHCTVNGGWRNIDTHLANACETEFHFLVFNCSSDLLADY